MSTPSTEAAALAAAARVGLVASPTDGPVVLDPDGATAVLARAGFDHLTGFLADAVQIGAVELDETSARALTSQWHAELLTCVKLEALAVRTAELLDGEDIEWRLTKGPALAHLDYADASIRTFGDIDIVVHPEDWSRAFDLLMASGYHRTAMTLPLQYDARYGKGATFASGGLEVDLHRRFAIGRFAVRMMMEEVFEAKDTIVLGGVTLPTLDPASRLLHACFHAALGGFRRLRAFRDVAQLILVTDADWQRTVAVAREWSAEAVIAAAITETWSRLGLELDHPAWRDATAYASSKTDQRVLDLFASGARFRSQALTAITRLPVKELPRFVWALAAPSFRRAT